MNHLSDTSALAQTAADTSVGAATPHSSTAASDIPIKTVAVAAPVAAIRYWLIAASHSVIDVFPIFFTSLMIALQDRLALAEWQVTVVYMATPIFSGGCQPLLAWLGDKHDTRITGPLGLALGALCISSIGLAQNFWQLIALQIVGVIGTGMYHPSMAALAGQIGGRAFRHGRGFAVSLFISAGMLGQTFGPLICTRINDHFGMGHLMWLIPPGVLAAVMLYLVVRSTPHRHSNHLEIRAAISAVESRARKFVVATLAAQNSLRFIVNIGLFVMFNYWAKARMPDDAAAASNLSGNLAAAMTLGMCISSIAAGRWIKAGEEKWPFALTALIGAVGVASFSLVGDWAWHMNREGHGWAMASVYFAAAVTAIGFFATIPTSIGVAQRLLPGHTALASALMMGLGWMISSLAKPLCTWLVGGVDLVDAPTISATRLHIAFAGLASLLIVSGFLAAFMPAPLLRRAAEHA